MHALYTHDVAESGDWKSLLGPEREMPYFKKLLKKIESQRADGTIIYPPNKEVFNAFTKTPLETLKVVILGQDPYHGQGQAHGLAFSVRPCVPKPPSLQNIFKELHHDVGTPLVAPHGCLESWAMQGVLLLNSVLTVEKDKAGSHAGLGWETFTDFVIKTTSEKCHGLVFMLWGSYAIKKGSVIDAKKHLVLTAPHPSPLSAHRGFLGCKHFSKANTYLRDSKRKTIDWNIV